MAAPPTAPSDLKTMLGRALALHQAGRLAEAEPLYGQILEVAPDHADCRHLLGVLHLQRGDYAVAIAYFDAAIAIDPRNPFAHSNRAVALVEVGRFDEALASSDRSLALKPDHAEALNNRGNALKALGRIGEALASYDRAIALKPDLADAFTNRAVALLGLKRLDAALASAERAVALNPNHAEAFNNRGNVRKELGQRDEALADYDTALALSPKNARAFVNRAVVLMQLRRFDEALASCDQAIALKPDLGEAFNNRGNALDACGRLDDALASYDLAIALKPAYADAFHNRGNALAERDRLAEAAASYDAALSLMPDHKGALGGSADCASRLCDWSRRDERTDDIRRRVTEGQSVVAPLVLVRYSDDPALQLACARQYARARIAAPPQPLWRGAIWRDDRIRLAYVSADFRQHPVAQLMVELFERHDRSRFAVTGVSFGPDDHSELRARLVRAFERFHDASAMSDRAAATLLHEQKADIVIDLTGYTKRCRPEILAHRPSPIAVNYLGYPGTMGADFIDYIIADATILPFDRQTFFTEKIVHLPDCFQANPRRFADPATAPTRREAGLPDTGFVFCCFNNHAKIAPQMFDAWMRLLGAVEGSVLWLSETNAATAANLRHATATRGIDPARLVFAPRTRRLEDHLARHRLAGLFLDTLPYNAHTTASDALRAGLPVLTCRGDAMAGRVAASLLHAVGLPELVMTNLADYEALALRLARDETLLAGIKAKLDRNIETFPLFDADRFRRHIEAAFTTMWDIWQRGEQPRSFAVAPDQTK
jgi:protein O-GlcNAc transferase